MVHKGGKGSEMSKICPHGLWMAPHSNEISKLAYQLSSKIRDSRNSFFWTLFTAIYQKGQFWQKKLQEYQDNCYLKITPDSSGFVWSKL